MKKGHKISSIIDYPHPGLDPHIWDDDGKLLPEHKEMIINVLYSYFKEAGLTDVDAWIKKIKIIGGITTYQYTFDSDIDIHIEVDLPKFIKTNKPNLTPEQAHEYLDEFRGRINKVIPKPPHTEHLIEYYFETPFVNQGGSPRSGLYNVLTDEWEIPPITVDMEFSIEDLAKSVVDAANEVAKELDISFGSMRRDVRRIEDLRHAADAWDNDQKKVYETKIKERLTNLEAEIANLAIERDKIVQDRRNYDPMGDAEIKFKYLQRFGYINLVTELLKYVEDDGRVTEDEVSDIRKDLLELGLKEASLDKKAAIVGYWVDPNGIMHEVNNITHFEWIAEKENMSMKTEEDQDKVIPVLNKYLADGWIRVYFADDYTIGMEVSDVKNLPPSVDSVVDNLVHEKLSLEIGDINTVLRIDDPFPTLQKAVNKALQQKRMGKTASDKDPKSWPGAGKLMIDFDNTIADNEKADYPEIGDLFPEAKAALDKLKENGWEIIIYSCRANEKKGIDDIKEFLDKHEIPYDDIFEGKPHAEYYIDDRNVMFTDWKDVLKQVKKDAMLKKAYLDNAYWVAPDGETFVVRGSDEDGTTHSDWIQQNSKLLSDRYGIDISEFGNTREVQKTTNDIINEMYNRGWARIGDSHKPSVWSATLKDLKNIPSTLETIFSEFLPEEAIVIIEDADTEGWVEVEYPWKSLQQSVNRELQRQRMGKKASLMKTAQLTWFAPDGQVQREFEIDPAQYGDLLSKGWVAMKAEDSRSVVVLVDDLEMTPEYVNDYLADVADYGSTVTIQDKHNNQLQLRYPFKNLQRTIQRELYKPAASFKNAKKGVTYDYSCVMAKMPDDICKKAKKFGKDLISDDDIYKEVEDGEHKYGRENDCHVTVLFGLHTNEVDDVKNILSGKFPAKIKFGKTGIFEPEGKSYDVVIVEIKSADLTKFNSLLRDNLEYTNDYDEYHPHLTLAYVKRGEGKKYKDKNFISDEIELDELEFSPAEGDRSIFSSKNAAKYSNSWTGYWISPEGEIHELVGQEEHFEWASSQAGQEMDELIQDGWVRVRESGDTLNIDLKDVKNLPAFLDKFIIEHPSNSIFIDDFTGASLHGLNYSDVIEKGLQRVVNRELTEKSIQPVSKKKADFLPGITPHAPTKRWGPTDVEIPVDPDAASEEKEWFGGEHADKPRNRKWWKRVWDWFTDEEPEDLDKNSSADTEQILQLTQQNGGATWNFSQGNLVGTDNYAVSTSLDRTKKIPADQLTVEVLDAYVEANQDLLSDSNNSLGTWNDGGTVYLDVVTTLADRDEAIELGKRYNQKAIFDLKNLKTIPTFGTGEFKKSGNCPKCTSKNIVVYRG